jgi:hypothetical protein
VARCHAETKEIIMLTTNEVYKAREFKKGATECERFNAEIELESLLAEHQFEGRENVNRIAWLELALDLVPF